MTFTNQCTFFCSLVVCVLTVQGDSNAQSERHIPLSPDQLKTRSAPFRDTVERFMKNIRPKVVGGLEAKPEDFPWQVSLGVSFIPDISKAHFCGGTIYAASWVITAAHCLDGTPSNEIVVTVGTNKLGVGGNYHQVKAILLKSDYNASTNDNDIALIELTQPLVFNNKIKAIPVLPTEKAKTLEKDVPLIVTGWGATQEGGETVRNLRYVEVPFVEREVCNRPLGYDGAITSNMICAGELSGGRDSCQGDSGGPLTVNTRINPELAGVVSWGEGCARPNRVGVYTRISNYLKWIDECIANSSNCNQ